MLVLSRKTGETILLRDENGKEVGAITIVRIGPNNVRVGLEFPKDIIIVRGELTDDQDKPFVSPRGGPSHPSLV